MAKYPKFHGITLAGNSAIENLHFERLDADPVPVTASRIWYNLTEKAIKFSTLDTGGAVVIRTIATGGDAEALASRVSVLEGLVSAIEGSYVKKDGSVAFTGDINAGVHRITQVAAPEEDDDAANKKFVLDSIAVLGNAFEYVGTVEGGAQGSPFDLATLAKQTAGDYYKVTTPGYFKMGASTFLANVGDGIIFNSAGGVDKIDNTDSNVEGTAGFITVTGSADTGFTVDVAQAFKDRVTAAEAAIATETSRAKAAEAALGGRLTTAEGSITTLQGQTAQLSTDLAAEVARAQSSESALGGQIAAEKTRAEGVEADLQAQITAAVGTGGTVAADLAAEIVRATGVEAGLRTDVDAATAAVAAEKTRAEGVEATLRTDVDAANAAVVDEETRAKGAEAALDLKIEEAENLMSDFVSAFNSQRKAFLAPAVALTHTFTHNLNTTNVAISVMVKGDDGIFRNDIVAYEETDGNTVTFFLTEARIIKATAQKFDNIDWIPY